MILVSDHHLLLIPSVLNFASALVGVLAILSSRIISEVEFYVVNYLSPLQIVGKTVNFNAWDKSLFSPLLNSLKYDY